MSSRNDPLVIHIVIYTEPSLSPHESHVALSVQVEVTRKFYVFHAVEDISTESEMKFERSERDRNPLGTKTPHQSILLQTSTPESQFESLSAVLAATPVPRPKPTDWNCQSWVREALMNMEASKFIPGGHALQYYSQMMNIINTTAKGVLP